MPNRLLSRGLKLLYREGFISFLRISSRYIAKKTYFGTVRKVLPGYRYQRYNDVKIERKKMGDDLFGFLSDNPDYESQQCNFIENYVDEGQTVTVIGSHYGVSAVVAADSVGPSGNVIVYEATEEGVVRTRRAARLNSVDQITSVMQAIVGPVHNLKGDSSLGHRIPTDELSECDVLAIDCDGCELEVLANLARLPDVLIIEHHGENPGESGLKFEYNEDRLLEMLNDRGYKVVDRTVRERTRGGFSDKIGHFVAVRE